ncbi:MAG TPA: aminoacyl-tRNA hydrolase [Rhizomicrobium sp.]|jgi:PTH1 family peptidyl-tRNA hydrolase|nr:aminoacyl-tRNA hydrolase [Rhizomicrobium sp.]
MPDTALLIAGLGNPGPQYAKNRHNAGFIVADELAAHYRFGPWKAKFDGLLSEGLLGGRKTYLLKPQTYMNDSGVSVGAALRFFKLPLSALVVIHDEIDLAAGKLKVKCGGGDAGQNGLRSITATLGPDYRRVRLGIGHPGDKARVTAHVLQNFSKEDIAWLRPLVGAVVEAAPLLAKDDDAGFMTKVALLTKPPKFVPPKSGPHDPS